MKTELNYAKVFSILVEATKQYVVNNNLKAMVLGISGGIDSTIVAVICSKVSEETGIPLIGRSLPIKNKKDEFDSAELVGQAFCDDFKTVHIINSYSQVIDDIVGFEQGFTEFGNPVKDTKQTPIANGNIQARLRMIYLYNLASIHNGLVMSTDNRTEYELGFWTLHGDVGDFNPLAGLWKTEVYGLAKFLCETYYSLKLEKSINKIKALETSISLTPTDGLGISNSDLEQIGAKSYDEVDDILQTLLDATSSGEEWADAAPYFELCKRYSYEVVNKVWKRHLASRFKRKNLPITIERRLYE